MLKYQLHYQLLIGKAEDWVVIEAYSSFLYIRYANISLWFEDDFNQGNGSYLEHNIC